MTAQDACAAANAAPSFWLFLLACAGIIGVVTLAVNFGGVVGWFGRPARMRRRHQRLLMDRAEQYIRLGLSYKQAMERADADMQREAMEVLAL